MNISETVPLPDPEIQPMVHPLDIPEARRDFYKAWAWEAFANPIVSLLIAAIVWLIVGSWVAAAFAFASTFGFGWMARRWSLREAWEFIPRKRQDRSRPLPFKLALASMVILALLLGASIYLLILRLGRGDLAPQVIEVCFGAGLVAVVFAYVILCFELFFRTRPYVEVLLGLIPLEVATAGITFAFFRLLGGSIPADLTNLLIGAAIMTVGGIAALVLKLVESRKLIESRIEPI